MSAHKQIRTDIRRSARKKSRKLVLSLFLLAAVLSLAALCMGNYPLPVADVLRILFSKVLPIERTWTATMETVIFLVRVPRICAALLIGSALSLSGAVYQGVFRNPLVSPDLLGVASGACVGAAAAILLGLNRVFIQIFALCCGLLAVWITTAIPRLLRNDSTMTLVLAGIIVAGFMTSMLGLAKYIADPERQLAEITYWTLGSLSMVKSETLFSVLPVMAVAAFALLSMRWRVNLLSLGDQQALTLGVNVKTTRGITILCSTALTGCAVCISGNVGWIGLVIPHLSRIVAGPDNSRLLPVAALIGACFMLIVDTLSRTVTAAEIPLSILTGFVGAPLYVWLLFHQRVKLK